jgi:hypothetical protein
MIARLFLLTILLICVSVHAEPFPTTFTIDSLDVAAKNVSAWNGKMIAVEGLVDSIAASYQNKPYFHVAFRDPNSKRKGIWIGWITKLDPHKIRIGDIVLVLGYLAEIDESDTLSRKLSQQPFHMLAMCMANVTTKEGTFSAEAQGQWDKWMNGTIPTPEALPADTSAHKSGPGLRLRLNK